MYVQFTQHVHIGVHLDPQTWCSKFCSLYCIPALSDVLCSYSVDILSCLCCSCGFVTLPSVLVLQHCHTVQCTFPFGSVTVALACSSFSYGPCKYNGYCKQKERFIFLYKTPPLRRQLALLVAALTSISCCYGSVTSLPRLVGLRCSVLPAHQGYTGIINVYHVHTQAFIIIDCYHSLLYNRYVCGSL